MTTDKKWAGTTFGSSYMHRSLIRLLRHTPVRAVYAFTNVFVIPVSLLLRPSGKIIYHYFRRRWGYSVAKSLVMTYVNHCYFGQIVVDKFAMWAGKRFKLSIVGLEHYEQLERRDEAFVQLSAHIGNYEIAGYSLTAKHKRFNALVYGGEKSTVMEERNKILSKDNIRLIAIKPDMSHLFELNAALAAGECVSLPADRIFGSSKSIEVTFLGKKAKFPAGPFQMPTMRGLNVLAVNVMKTSATGYTVFVTPLAYDKTAPRQEQMRQLATAYVAELERLLTLYPAQWYNYFEFWD